MKRKAATTTGRKRAGAKRAPAPDRALLLRAVRWARLPGHGHTIAEACAKFAISASVYRRAARELGPEARLASDDDLVLSALSPGGPTTLQNIIYYYDWINHGLLTPAQTLVILERLVAQGMVRRVREDCFELTREWP